MRQLLKSKNQIIYNKMLIFECVKDSPLTTILTEKTVLNQMSLLSVDAQNRFPRAQWVRNDVQFLLNLFDQKNIS